MESTPDDRDYVFLWIFWTGKGRRLGGSRGCVRCVPD